MVCDKTRTAHGGRAVSALLSVVPVMKSGRVTTHDANNPASGCHAPRERATNVANADFAHIRLDSTLLRLSSVVPAQAGLLAQPWAGASGWWRKIVAAILIGIFQTPPRRFKKNHSGSGGRGLPRRSAAAGLLAMTIMVGTDLWAARSFSPYFKVKTLPRPCLPVRAWSWFSFRSRNP